MVYFLDTSALIKRYVAEVGSDWISGLTDPRGGHAIVIAALTTVEAASVLARLLRLKHLSAPDAAKLHADFLLHVDKEYLSVPLDDDVLARARHLLRLYPLRTLDAIQLGCALEVAAVLGDTITFVCADNDLLSAASAEGFAVDNPLFHT